jgi:hypothetical protein
VFVGVGVCVGVWVGVEVWVGVGVRVRVGVGVGVMNIGARKVTRPMSAIAMRATTTSAPMVSFERDCI